MKKIKTRWFIAGLTGILLCGCAGIADNGNVTTVEVENNADGTDVIDDEIAAGSAYEVSAETDPFAYEPFPYKTADAIEYSVSEDTIAKLSSFDQMDAYDTENCYVISFAGDQVDVSIGLKENTEDNPADADHSTENRLDAATAQARLTDAIEIMGKQVRLRAEGTYILQGVLEDGQIRVELDPHEKIQLVLDEVSLSCSDSAPIYIAEADKALITLAPGTQNTLTDGAFYVDDAKGCLYSTCDLTINGGGTLTVFASYNNGISCKDDLKLLGGEITVTATHHGLKGNDSVAIYGGTLHINARGDGIKSDSETIGKGYLFLAGGEIYITAEDDAMQAFSAFVLRDAAVTARAYDDIISCDGYIEGDTQVLIAK